MNSSTMQVPNRLVGKVAIVTASTDGIGFAIAERLAKEGAKVVVSSRREVNVDRAVKTLKAQGHDVLGVICHVAKKEDRLNLIEQTCSTFGGIDILVANAGVNPAMGEMLQTTEAEWDKIFDVNLKSTFFICKEIVPYMEKRGGGSIVLNASTGAYNPTPIIGAYCVSKTAILGLTKAMAPQLAEMNIRINCLAPGMIKTRMSQGLWDNKEYLEYLLGNIPMKRIGNPGEIAGAAAFLVSDDASYMTGETVAISGGISTRL